MKVKKPLPLVKKASFLQDSEGNESSKRLWGSISLGSGIFLKLGLGLFSFISIAPAAHHIINVSDYLMLSGAILLGGGLLEKITKK